ncbi:MAG TPA: sigma-70 family RNA polymerase sigma factor [Thermoanaerobaculia bacterium]|nr:sigma-70 family RNA polymerase sigma factor [Thermoanaerobaculia bacterium]
MSNPIWKIERRLGAEAPSDSRLIAAVARGDRRSFEALYRRYYPRLFGYLLNLVGSRELAEEVLDDTMVVVWQKAGGFERRSKASTWIFGIAYRRALKGLTRRRREPETAESARVLDELSAPDSPERDLGRKELRESMFSALAELSIEQRSVVLLAYFEDLPYSEIASVLECPVNTVKTRMFHARRRLRALLSAEAQ